MLIESSTAAVTVSPALPDTLPEVAEIVVEPVAAAVASPLVLSLALLMVATEVFDEAQVTEAVMSLLLLSVNVPVAV